MYAYTCKRFIAFFLYQYPVSVLDDVLFYLWFCYTVFDRLWDRSSQNRRHVGIDQYSFCDFAANDQSSDRQKVPLVFGASLESDDWPDAAYTGARCSDSCFGDQQLSDWGHLIGVYAIFCQCVGVRLHQHRGLFEFWFFKSWWFFGVCSNFICDWPTIG